MLLFFVPPVKLLGHIADFFPPCLTWACLRSIGKQGVAELRLAFDNCGVGARQAVML